MLGLPISSPFLFLCPATTYTFTVTHIAPYQLRAQARGRPSRIAQMAFGITSAAVASQHSDHAPGGVIRGLATSWREESELVLAASGEVPTQEAVQHSYFVLDTPCRIRLLFPYFYTVALFCW